MSLLPPEYMNQMGGSSRLSEVMNPNYDQSEPAWARSCGPSPLEERCQEKLWARLGGLAGAPEYLNTARSSLPFAIAESMDNLDYQEDFLSTASPTGSGSLCLPAAENMEYLGLSAVLHAPIQ